MTTTAIPLALAQEPPLEIPPPPASHPFRARQVWRLLTSLRADPEQTELALQVFEAVGGDGGESTFQRFARTDEGQRLLASRPRIADHLADHEALAALPDGSFGRAYLDFATENGFDADGLAQINRDVERETHDELDPYRQWFWDRYSTCHDLWHVLTGCSTVPDDEAMLLAFSQAQTPQRGYRALLAMIVAQANVDVRFQLALVRAWRAGKRAAPLVAVHWEEQLARPIDELRRELRVETIAW